MIVYILHIFIPFLCCYWRHALESLQCSSNRCLYMLFVQYDSPCFEHHFLKYIFYLFIDSFPLHILATGLGNGMYNSAVVIPLFHFYIIFSFHFFLYKHYLLCSTCYHCSLYYFHSIPFKN